MHTYTYVLFRSASLVWFAFMASIDWKQCEYCIYYVDPDILMALLDPDGSALCPWCWFYIIDNGGVPEAEEHWWCTKQCQLQYHMTLLREGLPCISHIFSFL